MAVLFQTLFTSGDTAPTVFSDIVNRTFTNGNLVKNNFNLVNVSPVDISGMTQFRVTVENSTDVSSTIDAMWLGQLSGTTLYQFTSTPTQVLFGGTGAITMTTSGQSYVSDILTYTPSGTGFLGIAFHVNNNCNALRYSDSLGTGWAMYQKTGATDAALGTTGKSGYSANGTQRNSLITKVEAAA